MSKPIRRAAVIGAGVMGSGIAAHLANAGIEVLLMDMVPPGLSERESQDRAARNRFAAAGKDRAVKARPAAFFTKERARLVTVGNIEDDLEKVKSCDLVVEAIVEQLAPKRALFEKLETLVSGDCVVASNTSGIRIAEMVEGRSPSFRARFLVMHFFNPVRYMKLLELVAGPDTAPETLDRARRFGENALGKGVVVGRDTPNFVGNRIGVHGLMLTIHLMLDEALSPEDVDAICGEPMGHPKSASFRTADLVGLDTLVHVARNAYDSPDEDRAVFEVPSFVRAMVERKLLGDKTKAGFYRKGRDGSIETLDPKTLEYRARGGDKNIRALCKQLAQFDDPSDRVRLLIFGGNPAEDPQGGQARARRFAWRVLAGTFAYAARRVGEIAADVVAIDQAMRWGFNWDLGPFQMWDALGFEKVLTRMQEDGSAIPETVSRMHASGAKSFYTRDDRVFDLVRGEYKPLRSDPRAASLTVLRRGSAAVWKNAGAEAWDLGDGVLGLTFKTKANSIDSDVIEAIGAVVEEAEREFLALVVANLGEHFCVGANLFAVVTAAAQKRWDELTHMVATFQQACQKMKYAAVPVVAAPFGMTLGGGLEVCLGAGAVQAAAETYAGLVEVGVGLVPAGGGTMNLLWRAMDSIPEGTLVDPYAIATQVFKNIALARVATSSEEATRLGYLRQGSGTSFDRERLVADAKAHAVGLAATGWHAPAPRAYTLSGESGMATLQLMVDTLVAAGQASQHDAKIAGHLARIVCGGVAGGAHEVSEDELLELEREAFVSLCGEPKSQERMQHMLVNNKPLRN